MLGRLQREREPKVILFQFSPVCVIGIQENLLPLTMFFCSQCTAGIEKHYCKQKRQEKMREVLILRCLIHMARFYYSEYPLFFSELNSRREETTRSGRGD